MTDSVKNFILGAVSTTLLIVCALYLIGLAAVNAKREACTKFADITRLRIFLAQGAEL